MCQQRGTGTQNYAGLKVLNTSLKLIETNKQTFCKIYSLVKSTKLVLKSNKKI